MSDVGRENIDAKFYPEVVAGGFTRFDGTVAFFSRVNALLEPDMVILDLGAGRGLHTESTSAYRRALTNLKGKVRKVIGLDVDPIVMENPSLDEAFIYDGGVMPLPDNHVDVIVSDWTFEHIPNPTEFAREIERVLKPGGWLCARTPHLYSLLVVASSVIPNKRHSGVLTQVQPGRQERDVFPTCYKLNTRSSLRAFFPPSSWGHFSYTWSPEPAYHLGNPVIYWLMQVYQYLKRPILGGECLFVFLRKANKAPG
ncbi:MAG: class I SAM-dependent methyltransferase [Parvibaculum sp.]|nr:class I SAM-dependent methyltransferase [Parvibaculum sp.]